MTDLRYTRAMFRTTITYGITILLILMNIQAAIGDVSETFHTQAETLSMSLDTIADSDTHEGDTHCQHCCHAHASNIMVNEMAVQSYLEYDPHFYHRIIYRGPPSGPPTPPPNA